MHRTVSSLVLYNKGGRGRLWRKTVALLHDRTRCSSRACKRGPKQHTTPEVGLHWLADPFCSRSTGVHNMQALHGGNILRQYVCRAGARMEETVLVAAQRQH